jgi:phosphatidylglycerophosphate synthase
VYYPNEEEKADPTVYAHNVQSLMSRHLDLPACDAEYKDFEEQEKLYLKELEASRSKAGRFQAGLASRARRRDMIKAFIANSEIATEVGETASALKETATALKQGDILRAFEGGFIEPDGIRNLALHKYQSGTYTALDNFMNPFWLYLAKFVPSYISPNLVTITGFVIQFSTLVLAFSHYKYKYSTGNDLWGIEKWVMQLLLGFSFFCYQTFDAMDGKHARNTKQSTPLGSLVDHGFDTIVMFLNATFMWTLSVFPYFEDEYKSNNEYHAQYGLFATLLDLMSMLSIMWTFF